MTITITSPSDYQIYQRGSNGLADIPIAGTYTGSPTAIEASWNGGAYQTIDAAPAGSVFSGTLTSQPAGQGTLTVRFTNDTGTTDSVTFVGIGDVFLVAGQSNAAGYGDNNQVYSGTFKASMYKLGVGAWGELIDPTGLADPVTDGKGSVWPLLATRFMVSQGVPVGFITTAVGGTGIVNGDWAKDGPRYTAALATLTASGVNAIKAILWYQGEDEVRNHIAQSVYQDAMSQMLDDMQSDHPLLASIKMVVGQVGDRDSEPREAVDAIRLAQQDRWNNDPDILAGPLTYDINLDDGDQVHFGTGSDSELVTLADRWWRMLLYHFYGSMEGRAPRFVRSIRTGTTVTVQFAGGVMPLTGRSSGTGWQFTDNGTLIPIISLAALDADKVILTLAYEPTGIERISFGSNKSAHDTTLMDSGTYPLPPEPFINILVASADASISASPSVRGTGFYIDIEDSSGQRLGSGPIMSASKWRITMRMDKAGSFDFEMPATDPKATIVQKKRIARAYAFMNGQRIEVGAGVIDNIRRQPAADGKVTLQVSGDDLIRELTYRSVLNLKLYTGGNPVSHAAAVAAVGSYAPAGWIFTADGSPPNDSIYGYFNGETVLQGAIKVAQKSESHFYRGVGRNLIFASNFTSSGVRAIRARGELAPATCAIVSLSEQINTYDLITRIYPRGSGNANAQLTLRATTRTAPAGFILNKADNYIEHVASVTNYGRIERQIDFREIGPILNTDADIVAASNALFDAALETLKRRSTELAQATYTLAIAGCSELLRPMQSIRLVHRDLAAGLDINANLNILEATWQVDKSGLYTTGLKVSNADRWPASDVGMLADGIEEGHVYQALQQLNANSYVATYNKNIDADYSATFRFRFGNEVTQLSQVLFEFQLLPFESTVKTLAILTVTSSAGGSSVQSASSGGSHTHSVTIPAHSHTVTVAAHSHTVTVAAHTHTVTIPAHSHTVTIPGHTHTIPNHQHNFTIIGNGAGALTYDIGYGAGGTSGGMRHNINSTDHTVSTNASSGATTADSTTTVNNSSNLQAGVVNSSSQLAQTTPSSSTLAQSTPSSNLEAQSVQTSSSNGTHTHTVTIPSHTHTLTPDITTVYGIFREDDDRTYVIEDLEYRVNSGSWLDLDVADDAGDGWYALDITSDVQDSTTFRPLQTSNTIEIRPKTGVLSISSWGGGAGPVLVITFATDHNITAPMLPLFIEISGAAVGNLGSDINGIWTVTGVFSDDTLNATGGTVAFGEVGAAGGTATPQYTATIDAQLSVVNIIQAVAYA